MSFVVQSLKAVSGTNIMDLGPQPIKMNGLQIRTKIASALQVPVTDIKITFDGGPMGDTETLEDVGVNLEGDQVSFTNATHGGFTEK